MSLLTPRREASSPSAYSIPGFRLVPSLKARGDGRCGPGSGRGMAPDSSVYEDAPLGRKLAHPRANLAGVPELQDVAEVLLGIEVVVLVLVVAAALDHRVAARGEVG